VSSNQQLLLGEGAGGGPANYIEDVFSTYLYTGNGSTQTITNNIDLSTKGGLVWSKDRSGTNSHRLYDTVRGGTKSLSTNQTVAQDTWSAPYIVTFNSNGYETGLLNNENSFKYASWTFRKQPKFFDVVTYTGDGVAGRAIAHSLGSKPGAIIIKKTSSTSSWFSLFRASNTSWKCGRTSYNFALDTTEPADNVTSILSDASNFYPDDVRPNSYNETNTSAATYVAYLFAHDAGGFGLAGTDNVISCGSYTGAGSPYTGGSEVTLGYEPQWVLIKSADNATNWVMIDNMRGWETGTSGLQNWLYPNTSGAENTGGQLAYITSTGFKPYGSSLTNNTGTYIYIAIRRGPMKVPTVGTSVFSTIVRAGTGTATAVTGAGFPPDFMISHSTNVGTNNVGANDKLRGAPQFLSTNTTNAEATLSGTLVSFDQDGFSVGTTASGPFNSSGQTNAGWMFRRAPGFFDEVCYTGNAGPTGVPSSNQTINHNLTVAPELIITKNRSSGSVNWTTWNASKILTLNTSDSAFSTTTNYISTVGANSFVVNNPSNAAFDCNASGNTYVAYLFATCAGVSKVGTYTGNGSNQTIACGFTAGSRFVLIKRTDSTGDWYVWDSARGIIAGNDPHLSLNTTAAEVTTDDSVDTDNSGFIVNQVAATNVNVTSATYIFLAIA
jgi:hypothetical protein